jgi:predicted PurR-regulated permease PerM
VTDHLGGNNPREKLAIDTIVRYIALGLFLAGLLFLAYQVMSNFLVPVSWAVILVYVTWPLCWRVKRMLGGRETLGALLMTLMLTSVIVIPLVWVSFVLQKEIVDFYHNLPEWLEQKPSVPAFATRIPYLGQELENVFDQFGDLRALLRERVIPWLKRFSGNLLGMIENVGSIAIQTGFTLLTVFFLYRDGLRALGQVRKVLHLVLGERLEGYFATTEATVKAVVYGIVLTAIAQGTLAGFGYWAVGIKAPILLSAVTIFFALIPFGAPLVWGSASLWLFLHGEYWSAISLVLWGGLVVSWIDNVIRPLVISGVTRIPFLLVMFGVLGGLMQFGLIGLFLGPVILAISLAVWREWLEQHSEEREA